MPAATRDRLDELRARAGAGAGRGGAERTEGAGEGAAHPAALAQLLQEVERVQGWVGEVRAGTGRARGLLGHPAFHTDRDLQEQLDTAVTAVSAAGLKVCGGLRQLEAAGGAGGQAGRVARLQAACARRAFAAALDEHHALLAAARHHQLQLLRHHAHIVNTELSEEECEGLLDSQQVSLFVDNVRAETAAARLALREAEARCGDLRRVEAALHDVHGLFAQLAALVATQQVAIDSVEMAARGAGLRVDDGARQLLQGVATKKRARKKKMSLIVCLASGVLLVLLVLIFT